MKFSAVLCAFFFAVASFAGTSHAYLLNVYHPTSSGIELSSYSYDINVSRRTMNINTTWTSTAPSFLIIGGLGTGYAEWRVVLNFNNATGADWTSFALELLDPSGNTNDANYDALVQPDFIPAGYSSSNDLDGLSFAQGGLVLRTSDVFATVDADELDTRDFLDYLDGIALVGGSGALEFGLRDTVYGENQPFLLALRPNEVSVAPAGDPVPLPSALLLFGAGLLGLTGIRVRKRQNEQ